MSEVMSNKSTTYKLRRYFTPSSITAAQTLKARGAGARKRLMRVTFNYTHLIESHNRKVQFEGLNPQTAANRATALRKFLEANFIAANDVVGREMRSDYSIAIERFTHKLVQEGRSSRAISNTKSALRIWREMVIEHDTIEAQHGNIATPFIESLRQLVNEKSIALVARQSGVPLDMLRGWLVGKRPRGSSAKFIVRLERFFGVEPNCLLQVSGAKLPGTRVQGVGGDTKPIKFRNVIGELTRVIFCIKPNFDSPLRAQWRDFLVYKTAATLGNGALSINGRRDRKKRTRRGKWRVSPCPLTVPSDANWWSFLPVRKSIGSGEELREVASARIAWARVSAYLGWLRLSQEEGGAGVDSSQVETLAWLACPGYIEQYLDWTKKRVGARNQGALQFLAFVASLVRPDFGYLAQSLELAATLPANCQSGNWAEMCDETFEITRELTASYDDEMEVSRDSFEPILHILQMPQPMDAIVDMVQRMKADRPISKPAAEATWSRDIVLIKLLSSNPLRLRNLAHLTWRADNTGELHQREGGSWWIKIHKTKFKNVRGAAGDREFYESQGGLKSEVQHPHRG